MATLALLLFLVALTAPRALADIVLRDVAAGVVLDVTCPSYSFPPVPVGNTTSWTVEVSNNGSSPVLFSGTPTFSAGGIGIAVSMASSFNFSFPLDVGASATLTLMVTPSRVGLHMVQAVLSMPSNDTTEPNLLARFDADVYGAKFVIDVLGADGMTWTELVPSCSPADVPGTLFPDIIAGQNTSTRQFRLRNSGTVSAVAGTVQNTTHFTFVGTTNDTFTGTVLNPDDTLQFTLMFSSTSWVDPAIENVAVSFPDPAYGSVYVRCYGYARQPILTLPETSTVLQTVRGENVTHTVVIRSTGNYPLVLGVPSVTCLPLPNNALKLVSDISGVSVAQNGSLAFGITSDDSVAPGSYLCVLGIASNDPVAPVANYTVSLDILERAIAVRVLSSVVSPPATSIAVNDTYSTVAPPTGTYSFQVFIDSVGTAPLQLNSLTLSDPVGMTFDYAPVSVSLAPNTSATAVVRVPVVSTDVTDLLSIFSNAYSTPSFTLYLQSVSNSPILQVWYNSSKLEYVGTNPPTVGIGLVNVNDNRLLNISLVNAHSGVLNVSVVNLFGTAFSLVNFSTPALVAAYSEGFMVLKAAPTVGQSGLLSALVSITSNTADRTSDYVFFVTMTVVSSQLQVMLNGSFIFNGAAVDLGVVQYDETRNYTFQLTNGGTGDLYIFSNTSTFTAGTGYSLVSSPSSTLPPGGTTTIEVSFHYDLKGVYTALSTICTNDPVTPCFSFSIYASVKQPKLSVSLDSAFGAIVNTNTSVVLGSTNWLQSFSRDFVISNSDTGTLWITSISLASPNMYILPSMSFPISIGWYGTLQFSVWFNTTMPGTFSGSLTIGNNDPNGSVAPFYANVTVIAQSPYLQVEYPSATPIALNYSAVDVGSTQYAAPLTVLVIVRNIGDAALMLSGAPNVTGAGFTAGAYASPTVAPGATTTFPLTLNYPNASNLTGFVTLQTDDTFHFGSSGQFSFYVVGRTLEPQIHVFSGDTEMFSGVTVLNDGDVQVGTNFYHTFVVANTGDGFLTASAAVTGSSTVTISTQISPTTIAAGANGSFVLRVFASAPSSVLVSVTITNNDISGGKSPFKFNVTLVNRGSDIYVIDNATSTVLTDGSSIVTYTDPGSTCVTFTDTNTRVYVVQNRGNDVLLLGQPSISGVSSFYVSENCSSLSLAPGENATFAVTFFNSSLPVASYVSSVALVSNDYLPSTFDFTVRASTCTPQISVRLGAVEIESGVTTIDYGSVTVPAFVNKTYLVRNIAPTGILHIGAPTTFGNGFVLISGPAVFDLLPGTSTPLVYSMWFNTPLTAAKGNISIACNDPDSSQSPFSWFVSGVVNAPEIDVRDFNASPLISGVSLVDFGATDYNISLIRVFTVRNLGSLVLTLSNPVVNGTGYFLQAPLGSTSLAAGGLTTFAIGLLYWQRVNTTATVTIASNDYDEPVFSFNLTGNVYEPVVHIYYEGVDLAFGGGAIVDLHSTPTGVALVNGFTVVNEDLGTLRLTCLNVTGPELTVSQNFNATTLAATASSNFALSMYRSSFGPVTSTLTVCSNDFRRTPFNVTLVGLIVGPEIEVGVAPWTNMTSELSVAYFGTTVQYSEQSDVILIVANVGNGNLSLSASAISGTGFSILADVESLFLVPGANTTLTVSMLSATAATLTGNLTIQSDDFSEPHFVVRLSGSVVVPDINVISYAGQNLTSGVSNVTLGSVVAGSPLNQSFILENIGLGYLTIHNVSVLNPTLTVTGTAPNLSYSGAGIAVLPPTLSPKLYTGESDSVVFICYSPTPAHLSAQLAIFSNDLFGNENPFLFSVFCVVSGPELSPSSEGVPLVSGNSTVEFGDLVQYSVPSDRVIVLSNAGVSQLEVSNILVDGTGFTLLLNLSLWSIAPGSNASFTLRMLQDFEGNLNGSVTILSNDFDENPFVFYVHGRVVEPDIDVLDFNSVSLTSGVSDVDLLSVANGVDLDRMFYVTNVGLGVLNLTNVAISGTGLSIISGFNATVLNTGDWASFVVRVRMDTPYNVTGNISIANNDITGGENPFMFNVHAVVIGPEIVVEAPSGVSLNSSSSNVTFGSFVQYNEPSDITFTVYNSGNSALNLAAPTVTGSGFALQTALSSTVLNPFDSATFTVRLLSPVEGLFQGTVSLPSDDLDENPFVFYVHGRVVEPDIDVLDFNSVSLTSGVSDVDLLSVANGVDLDRMFYVTNVGLGVLNLTNVAISGTGLSIISGFNATVLNTGDWASFVVRVRMDTPYNVTGNISIANNDITGGENPFMFNVHAVVIGPEIVVYHANDSLISSVSTVQFSAFLQYDVPEDAVVVIHNGGNLDLNIATLIVSGVGFSLQSNLSNFVVIPGANESFTIRMLSSTAANLTGSVTVTTDDFDEPSFVFFLIGRVVEPDIAVRDAGGNLFHGPVAVIDVGFVADSSALLYTLYVVNLGEGLLNLTSYSFSGTGFTITNSFNATELYQYDTASFTVMLTYFTALNASASLAIFSNDITGIEDPFTVNLTGVIVGPEIVVEAPSGVSLNSSSSNVTFGSFVQYNEPSDITFTVYNSGNSALNLAAPTVTGSGFALQTALSSTVLNPFDSATFTVRLLSPVEGLFQGTVSLPSDDLDENPFVFYVHGRVVEPDIDVLDFNSVSLTSGVSDVDLLSVANGVDLDRMFYVTNVGLGVLNLTNVAISGTGLSIISGFNATVLNTGDWASFVVRVRMDTPYNVTGNISIANNDITGGENPFMFNVHAVVIGPEIVVEAPSGVSLNSSSSNVTFGSFVQYNEPSDITFTVYNSGNSALNLAAPTVTGSGFALQTALSSTVLNPFDSATFTVRLLSPVEGLFQGTVSLPSDDLDENPFVFYVHGRVVEPDIDVLDFNSVSLTSGVSDVDLLSVANGVDLDRMFYVTNVGLGVLNLTNVAISGTGLSIISGFNATVLNTGDWASFVVRVRMDTPYNVTGNISIANNDITGGENPFIFNVHAIVLGPELVLYDQDGLISNVSQSIFGSCRFNESITRNFSIYNAGNQDLVLVAQPSMGGAEFTLSSPLSSLTVAPYAMLWYQVTFQYGFAANVSRQMTLTCNDFDESLQVVELRARSLAPVFQIFDVDHATWLPFTGGSDDFGMILTGTSSNRTLEIHNRGDVFGLVSSPVVAPSDFSVTIDISSNLIAPGASQSFSMMLLSDAPVNATANVTVSTDDPALGGVDLQFVALGLVLGGRIRVYDRNFTALILPYPFNSSAVDFGINRVYNSHFKRFDVVNDGSSSLQVYAPVVSNAVGLRHVATRAFTSRAGAVLNETFELSASYNSNFTNVTSILLEPNSNATFELEFLAAQSGVYSAHISILSNDTDLTVYRFNISGRAVAPEVRVYLLRNTSRALVPTLLTPGDNGTAVDFGSAVVNVPLDLVFRVENAGDQILELKTQRVGGAGFSVETESPDSFLEAGESTMFTVRMLSSTVRTVSGSVSFLSSDPNVSEYTFAVYGNVTAAPESSQPSSLPVGTISGLSAGLGSLLLLCLLCCCCLLIVIIVLAVLLCIVCILLILAVAVIALLFVGMSTVSGLLFGARPRRGKAEEKKGAAIWEENSFDGDVSELEVDEDEVDDSDANNDDVDDDVDDEVTLDEDDADIDEDMIDPSSDESS